MECLRRLAPHRVQSTAQGLGLHGAEESAADALAPVLGKHRQPLHLGALHVVLVDLDAKPCARHGHILLAGEQQEALVVVLVEHRRPLEAKLLHEDGSAKLKHGKASARSSNTDEDGHYDSPVRESLSSVRCASGVACARFNIIIFSLLCGQSYFYLSTAAVIGVLCLGIDTHSAVNSTSIDGASKMSTLLALSGLAAAGDVLWYTGHSSPISTSHSTFDSAMTGVGSTGVDGSSSWPSSLSGYKVIVLAVSSSSFSSAEVTDVQTFLSNGGILVLMGESTGYNSSHVSVFNTLLSSLGMTNTFSSSGNYDSGCGNTATVTKKGHSLTDGLTSLDYAYSGEVIVGSGGVELLQGYSGHTLIAYEDQVVMAADSNLFDDSCTLTSGNSTFFENLYNGVCSDPKTDEDADGYIAAACGGDDCDDTDPSINPDTIWYVDSDGDGYGDSVDSIQECRQPSGYVNNADDCNDIDPDTIYLTWYIDGDGDGYGDASDSVVACTPPSGYVEDATDCEDTSAASYPGGIEVCDELDNDCNGSTDDGATDAPTWYFDADSDGFGDEFDILITCDQPSSYTAEGGDCDDEKANINPNAFEYCNEEDDNCNGSIDEDAVDVSPWYPDLDGDGYGDANSSVASCDQPIGYVGNSTDCDDTDETEWTEVPGLLNSCTDAEEGTDTSSDKACSAVSGVSGGLMLALAGLWGRRRRS